MRLTRSISRPSEGSATALPHRALPRLTRPITLQWLLLSSYVGLVAPALAFLVIWAGFNLERAAMDRRIEVDVRTALLRVDAARARLEAGTAAAAQARESQRIVRERYDAGLATMTDVLRALDAAASADLRASTAELDVVLESVMRDRAAGDL